MSNEEKTKLRTLDVKPRNSEAIKPAELIQVTGHHELTLNAAGADHHPLVQRPSAGDR